MKSANLYKLTYLTKKWNKHRIAYFNKKGIFRNLRQSFWPKPLKLMALLLSPATTHPLLAS